MYFYDRMFNPQYVNQDYYLQLQQQQYYETTQNLEVQKAVNYLENHFNKKEKSLMKPKKPEQAPRL